MVLLSLMIAINRIEMRNSLTILNQIMVLLSLMIVIS